MNIKNTVANLIAVIILVLLYHFVGGYISANQSAFSFFAFLHIWTLLLGGYFARSHVKTWLGDGKFRIAKGYIIVPILYILSYTPLFGSVMVTLSPSAISLFAAIASYNLIMAVCKE